MPLSQRNCYPIKDMKLKKDKLLVVSIHGDPAPAVVDQVRKIMISSPRIRFESNTNIKNTYPSLNTATRTIVLLTLQTNKDLAATSDFLKTYVDPIRKGLMRVLVINNFTPPKNLQNLLTQGCAEILLPGVSVVELLTRIQDGTAALNTSIQDTALGEMGISQKDLKHSTDSSNEFKYLEEDVPPWKKGADAFKSIELIVNMKRTKSKVLDDWFKVLLIANYGTEVLVEIPQAAGDAQPPFEQEEEISLKIVAANGDPSLNFELLGKITGKDTPNPLSLTVISITPISGGVDKLKSLADQFTKRQDEVLDFFKAAKGN